MDNYLHINLDLKLLFYMEILMDNFVYIIFYYQKYSINRNLNIMVDLFM